MKYLLLLLVTINAYSANKHTYIVEFIQEPLAVDFGSSMYNKAALDKKLTIKAQHENLLAKLSTTFNKTTAIKPVQEYFYAINGLALVLTIKQANWIKKQAGVLSIQQEKTYTLETDIGPSWIGANSVWEGLQLDTPGNRGEGRILGIIDSGINPQHPSFQSVSEAGTINSYTHTNPKGRLLGLCNSQTCNNKLIGIYDFTSEGTRGIDSVGHGSHVAGIAGGNFYTQNFSGLSFRVSGVAPHANIISYKACFFSEDRAGGLCNGNALLRAIDQAAADRVDVINYSIGADTPCSPWAGLDQNGDWCGQDGVGLAAKAMLNARNAGVLSVVAAGNNGPGPSTTSYPAIAPWVIAVANTTHSRQLQSSVVDFTGGNSTIGDLIGASATGGIGPLKIVHAKDFGNALCGQGDPELKSKCSGTGNDVLTGASNPFARNTFNGQIVVCDRGSYGRVEKGFNVKQAGAAGYILANTVGEQESTVADSHCLPATHLGNIAGTKLRNWLDSGSSHMGTITGQSLVYDDTFGDVMSSSSSRGPSEIIYNSTRPTTAFRRAQNYLKPNISAPGSGIISAVISGSGLTTKSGTSMASPHVAGAVALLKASNHGHLTPAQITSALILTADSSQMLQEDKLTKARFFDQGSGRTRVDQAIGNSIYFDISRQDFINANPQNGGDVSALNLPEVISNNCYPSCDFTRKVKLVSSFNVVDPFWQVSVESDNGLQISVTPNEFDFSSNQEITLNIHIDTTANDVLGNWAQAKIVFDVKSRSNSNPFLDTLPASQSKMPVAVFVPSGDYPEMVNKRVSNRQGRFTIDVNNIAAMTDATFFGSVIKAPQVDSYSLASDNNSDVFNSDGEYETQGSSFNIIEITTKQMALIVEANSTGNIGADLYIGRDININSEPNEFEKICEDKGFSTKKTCILNNVKPGKYWIMVNNKRNNQTSTIQTQITMFSENEPAQRADILATVFPKSGTGLYINAPVKADSNLNMDVFYQLPINTSQTNNYFGIIAVGADENSVGKTAVIAVKLIAINLENTKLYALHNQAAEFSYDQSEALSNMFIDTGLGAHKIILNSLSVSYTVNFYKTPLSFDPLNIKPDLSGLTPEFTASSQAMPIGVRPPGFVDLRFVEFDVSSYSPSRWYVEVTPTATSLNTIALQAEVLYLPDELIEPNQSLWFNPNRSGWGIDLSRTNSAQAITWYRYNEDGTQPTWLQAIGNLEEKNQFAGDLKLVRFNGENTKQTVIGNISMVYTSQTTGVITFSMPDKTYSEPIASIYASGQDCPQVNNNQQLDIIGLWFLPAQSGFGNAILATDTIESTVFYFYDETGMPTWAIGNRQLSETSTQMNQVTLGFCPDCQALEIEKQAVGTIINQYTDENSGDTTADINLIAPLSGHWQSSGQSAKLNKNFGCLIN